MVIALPLLGAAAGGLLTSGAAWAISAGWMIGSWIMNSMNEEQTKIFDPGAEEMPTFNQALRGATMNVTFGTNRVGQHVVWQKNFTTIRHESKGGGGGGKFGGSGMGGKGGGSSSGEAQYEYKWDLLFHCGMSHEPVSLYGGWLGSERLDDATILALINSSNSGFSNLFLSDTARPKEATLAFDDSYFHNSSPTGDTLIDNWDHFETSEGGTYRWPYTYYVGFKQLVLGNTPRVPQISWEIGPGSVNFTFNSAFKSFQNTTFASDTEGVDGPSGGMFKGDDGVRYQIDGEGKIINVDTNTIKETISTGEFDTFCTDLGLDPGSAHAFTRAFFTAPLQGTNYFIGHGYDIGFASRTDHAFVVFKINGDSQVEAITGYQGRNSNLEIVGTPTGFYRHGEATDEDDIIFLGISGVGADEAYLVRLPSIFDMQFFAPFIESGTSDNFEDRMLRLPANVTEIQDDFPGHNSYRAKSISSAFFLPVVSAGIGIEWTSKLCFYIGKSDLDWAADNPGNNGTMDDLVTAGFEGGIFAVEVFLAGTHALNVDNVWTDITASFTDRFGGAALPFPDAGFLIDETTEQLSDDYNPAAQVELLTSGMAAGATAIIFWKNIGSGSADRDTIGTDTYTQARVFIWNPFAQTAQQYFVKPGSFADRASDWGYTSAYETRRISGHYFQDDDELYIGGQIDAFANNQKMFASKFGDLDIGGGEDVLPPYIIRTILTDPVIGIGIDDSTIDEATYRLALNYCDAEGIRVSVQYRREENLLQVIEQLLSLYGGYLIDSGGQVKFGLQEFTASPIRTIDNDHLLVAGEGGEPPVTVIKGARQDVFNKVKINYFDRNLEYRQNFVEFSDEVDIDVNGLRPTEYAAKFVMAEETANKIGLRTLWSNLYGRDQYVFKLGPKDADLEPGDVITLVDSHEQTLQSGKQARIVLWEEREPMNFNVRAVEEVEYINASTITADNATETSTRGNIFGSVAPAADFTMYELPKEFQGADAQVYVGWRQQGAAMGANLFTSADGVSFALTSTVQPFIISGILAGPIPVRDPGYVEENIEVYLMPDTRSAAFDPSSPTYAQTFQLDDVAENGRALGAGALWINSEMLAYQGVNLIAQNHYRFDKVWRGWGGTHIQGHSSGDTWHKHGGGVFAADINQDKIGSIIHYKVAPFNFTGVYFDIASVDARTYQIQGTYWRPQNQAPIRTYVQSPGSFLTVQSENLGVITKKNVIAGGSAVQMEWPDASRDAGYGAQGYGTGEYGRFTADTTSHQYRVEVLSSDLTTVVRCTTVSTTAFNYDLNANSEDFNGWSGGFAIKVTPFNDIGDALRNRTKILELFE